MNAPLTPGLAGPPLNTHDMVVIHRAFRRESLLLASLIASVADGDRGRARALAAHLRWYRLGLHNHHHGEDELIWPLLRARADLQAGLVLRMEAQHERVAESLDRVMLALPAWEASASASARGTLADSLREHRGVLLEHLDDEEAHLLPVARRYLTRLEWDALGEHFLASTPKRQLLIFLGAVLEDANASERASVLTAMPVPARLIWQTIGRVSYARHTRRVRGRASNLAANAVCPGGPDWLDETLGSDWAALNCTASGHVLRAAGIPPVRAAGAHRGSTGGQRPPAGGGVPAAGPTGRRRHGAGVPGLLAGRAGRRGQGHPSRAGR